MLKEYFKNLYDQFRSDWNVESSLEFFGKGKSNEGTDESKFIKRYYVVPNDSRFEEIYLNFDEQRNIESVVWFLKTDGEEYLTLGALQELFGAFQIRNIIYDETTAFIFHPNSNKVIASVTTTIMEWVEKRKDGTLYYTKENKEFDIDDNYRISSVTFVINNGE